MVVIKGCEKCGRVSRHEEITIRDFTTYECMYCTIEMRVAKTIVTDSKIHEAGSL